MPLDQEHRELLQKVIATTREGNEQAHEAYVQECKRVEAYRERCEERMTTIRDDFAKAALPGLIADGWAGPKLAEQAYVIADHMLAERAK